MKFANNFRHNFNTASLTRLSKAHNLSLQQSINKLANAILGTHLANSLFKSSNASNT